jgi:hypothetical protein
MSASTSNLTVEDLHPLIPPDSDNGLRNDPGVRDDPGVTGPGADDEEEEAEEAISSWSSCSSERYDVMLAGVHGASIVGGNATTAIVLQ